MHANIVLGQDFLDYAPLFGEIADAYYEREMYSEAGVLYELLGEDPVVTSFHYPLSTGTEPVADKQLLYLAKCSCMPSDARKLERSGGTVQDW